MVYAGNLKRDMKKTNLLNASGKFMCPNVELARHSKGGDYHRLVFELYEEDGKFFALAKTRVEGAGRAVNADSKEYGVRLDSKVAMAFPAFAFLLDRLLKSGELTPTKEHYLLGDNQFLVRGSNFFEKSTGIKLSSSPSAKESLTMKAGESSSSSDPAATSPVSQFQWVIDLTMQPDALKGSKATLFAEGNQKTGKRAYSGAKTEK